MVLIVPFDEFPEAAKRIGAKDVYVTVRGRKTLLTAAEPKQHLILTSQTELDPDLTRKRLATADLNAFQGQWADSDSELDGAPDDSEAFVVAVSYHSRDPMPGLWMDAYPTSPTPQIVLRAMYEEFKSNGEIGDVSYEDFLRLAKPNVVILSPGEIATYLLQKHEYD